MAEKKPGRGVRPTFPRAVKEAIDSLFTERADCRAAALIAVQSKENGEQDIAVRIRGDSLLLDGALEAWAKHGTGGKVRLTIIDDRVVEEDETEDEGWEDAE